ncbi:hypothetical protein SARC_03497 [Sphaeroforma arctica JP610]|uniref:Uncharacterized protein n=1 Tax=Sphaeroforma arctica JP610 TaxID=667725 RepID=A0A0L0G5G6_9EUKA|nr:hypothetical protein SARC_03497 [Sphaeroforma arctica JP610]KNC84270.1 hypothetical protein SARC_03497 [Sphaeroforma arctica JP610]|eukprot:XP_014158172.1 hypothetical protein SARC_03497 [Sphaeroforma arctica JP610]
MRFQDGKTLTNESFFYPDLLGVDVSVLVPGGVADFKYLKVLYHEQQKLGAYATCRLSKKAVFTDGLEKQQVSADGTR